MRYIVAPKSQCQRVSLIKNYFQKNYASADISSLSNVPGTIVIGIEKDP